MCGFTDVLCFLIAQKIATGLCPQLLGLFGGGVLSLLVVSYYVYCDVHWCFCEQRDYLVGYELVALSSCSVALSGPGEV